MDIALKLQNYLEASYYCIAINTFEEARSLELVTDLAKKLNKNVYLWSANKGVIDRQRGADSEPIAEYNQAFEMQVQTLFTAPEDSLFIFQDLHNYDGLLNSSIAKRAFRELIFTAPKKGSCVIVISPTFRPWDSIEKFVTVVEFTLPTKKELEDLAKKVFESLKDGPKDKVAKLKASITPAVINALSGLSSFEAENALGLSFIETGIFDATIINREKVAAVKRSELLEIVAPEPLGIGAIGGLDVLKDWIKTRKRAYSPEAEKYGLPIPKGVLITGIPGTGKSLSAKAIGTALGVPTLRLDVGSLFDKYVGGTEQKTRETLRLAEAISPCVLWVDEVEKALDTSSGGGDSGVSTRLFGTLLTWMQDKKAPVFLVMTANEVWRLPAPFLRRGRFDELFAVDLPNKSERIEILSIVISERGRDPKNYDLAKIAQATEGFVGSEIKSLMADALYNVFNPEALRDPTTEDLIQAAQGIIPISKTSQEDIQRIKNWAKGRAKNASKPEEQKQNEAIRKITRRE